MRPKVPHKYQPKKVPGRTTTLEAKLLASLASGEPTEMTAEDWQQLRQKLTGRTKVLNQP